MKIAVNTRFLLKNKLEGIGRFTAESMKRLVKAHPEVEFLFFFDRPYDESFIFAENVTPVVLFPPARHPFLFYWWFEFSVTRALRKYKADYFISTDGFLSLRTTVKTLLVIHDIAFKHYPDQVRFWESKYYNYFMHRFFKKADRLITVSEYSKSDLVKHYNINPDKIDIAYNAGDKVFQPLPESEQQSVRNKFSNGCPYFLYVGSVHPRKNIVRLLQAFDQFKSQNSNDCKLVVVGRMAWQTGRVHETVKTLEFKDEIIFLDYLGGEDLANVMAAAYTLVYVSILEGFGIPILEAMHAEVPVITSNVSSMPEVAGEAALLADPFSVPSIAEKLEEIWQNEPLRQKLIVAGKTQRQKFNWESTAERLWASIEKMK
ncbi:MAG: glycosyltransferase family 1 protein [Bacteroidota bacterium]